MLFSDKNISASTVSVSVGDRMSSRL